MLVLSRHQNERVIIGDREVIVTVIEIRGDKVRLGFEAAPEIEIHREEIADRINREGKIRKWHAN